MSPAARAMLARLAPHRPALALAVALLAVSSAVPALTVLALRAGLDAALAGAGPADLVVPAAILVGLAVVDAGLKRARAAVTRRVAGAVVSRLRAELHAALLAGGGPESQGRRLALLTHDADELAYAVSAAVTALRNPVTLAALALTAATLAPALAAVALLLAPLAALPVWWSNRRLRQRADEARQARADLVHLAADQLAHASVIRDFDAGSHEAARFAAIDAKDREAKLALELERLAPAAWARLGAALAVGVLLVVGGGQVAAGQLDASRLVAFVVALGLMDAPLQGLSEVGALTQRALAALQRAQAALSGSNPSREPSEPLALPQGPLGLSFEGVRFGYGADELLRGFSLEVPPGRFVALVGASGAGKSTALALAARGMDPGAGAVRLGGLDLRALTAAERRQAVAVVPQASGLLARSLRDNLCLGRPLSDGRLEDALRRARADFVFAWPSGLDTPVEAEGRGLSGGERQRLCLARALAGAPRVLLLDEPTNQLDAEAAAAVAAALREARGGATVLLVAHDRALAEAADAVAFLADGAVSAFGPHQDLLGSCEPYRLFWEEAP